jgi:hypothetical protein
MREEVCFRKCFMCSALLTSLPSPAIVLEKSETVNFAEKGGRGEGWGQEIRADECCQNSFQHGNSLRYVEAICNILRKSRAGKVVKICVHI